MADDVVQVQKNGTVVAEILENSFKVKLLGFGGDIACPLDRTVSVIGKLILVFRLWVLGISLMI